MLAHLLREQTHANAGEVVDGEPSVARVVHREEPVEAGTQDGVQQSLPQLRQSEMLRHVLEQNLDENTAARGSLFLVQVDNGQDMPANCVAAQDMTKEASNVAEAVRLVPVNRLVVLGKRLLEQVSPEAVQLGKPLADEAVELGIRPLLRAALNHHGRQLGLPAGWKIDLHQLVAAFFKVDA